MSFNGRATFLLTEFNSCLAPTRLLVFEPPLHIPVTDICFCSRILTSDSPRRKVIDELTIQTRTIGITGSWLSRLWLGNKTDREFLVPSLPLIGIKLCLSFPHSLIMTSPLTQPSARTPLPPP